jgi:hypothetical protein
MRRLPFLAVSLLVAVAVSSCSSTQDVLEPSAIAAAPPAEGVVQAEGDVGTVPAQTASTNASAPLNPAVASRTRLRFDPIVGATVDAATPLTERLATRAKARGIGLAGSTDPSTTHVLKGYFSTITEGKETTVIYVWDVYDPSGNRLHRINGQQKAPSNGSEGWSAVSSATMQTIADLTIDELAAWLAGRTG